MNDPFINDSLRMLEIKAELAVEKPIIWNSFPGSVLHGALGFTTKKRSCVTKTEKCEECFLKETCFYTLLFEAQVPKDSSRMRKYDRIPPGLRLTFDPWDAEKSDPGEKLIIGMTLFGQAIQTTISLLLSLEETFQKGIGRKSNNGDRGTANLDSIAVGKTKILWENIDFEEELPVKVFHWREINFPFSPSFRLKFTSPTRIKAGGKIASNPTFRDIFSTVVRRITNLAYFYGDVEFDVDFKGMVKVADSVKFESNFRQAEMARYSSRQMQRMSMNGIVGEMTVHDCPEQLLPWIALGSKLGLGKNTSMGMGRYEVVDKKLNDR